MGKRVSDLEGAELALWVAKAEGVADKHNGLHVKGGWLCEATPDGGSYPIDYRPDTDWSIGGPIMEREGIARMPIVGGRGWWAELHVEDKEIGHSGDRELVAGMRCYVAYRFGEVVGD